MTGLTSIYVLNIMLIRPVLNNFFHARGIVKLKDKNNNAINDFRKAIAIKSDDYKSYFMIGKIKFEAGEYENAIINYNKAYKINENDLRILYNRALSKGNLSQFNSALTDLNILIKKDRNNIKGLRLRGAVNEQLSNINDACKDWGKAISLGDKISPQFYSKNCE